MKWQAASFFGQTETEARRKVDDDGWDSKVEDGWGRR